MSDANGNGRASTSEVVRKRWRLAAGWGLVVLGAIFIVLGWIGVSGTPDVARQLSYLASGGLGGLTAAVVGVGLLISDDLRSERGRLGRIEATLLDVRDSIAANGKSASKTTARSR